METVEPAVNLATVDGASVSDISKPTDAEAESGGESTKWEYEFSTYSQGRVMFIGMWDSSDVSACERLLHQPMKPGDITYSPETGNGFVVDEYGNKFTFKKKPYHRTVEWPDFGDMKAEGKPTPAPSKPRVMSVEELLAGI